MKASAVLSALTMAVMAIAAPSDIEARSGSGGSGTSCTSGRVHNGQKVCCSSVLGILNCVVSSTCNGDSYCCNTQQNGVINIGLDCVHLL
ncbi:fungal hydrophobin domain-containing protein [Fusarium mundagurra]|uniref:Fungal hydrophobin domain-containing protein n=1 Tax=Fusarium mundagurra TaxID=1567541 RepID=A0A8H5YNY8_9HYPO|nr:fungal hydrophobin domain-containing protein [Fusarium mundagurra]